MPVVDAHHRILTEGIEVDSLPGFGPTVVADAGREVANLHQVLPGLEKRTRQGGEVEPSGGMESGVSKAVVEVEAVDVDDHTFGTHGGRLYR